MRGNQGGGNEVGNVRKEEEKKVPARNVKTPERALPGENAGQRSKADVCKKTGREKKASEGKRRNNSSASGEDLGKKTGCPSTKWSETVPQDVVGRGGKKRKI